MVSLSAGAAALLSLFNVSIRRRTGVGAAIAGLYLVAFVGYYLLWYRRYAFWAACLWALAEFATVVALGMYVRARRQLVASLRERAEQAETAQQLLAEQARQAERTRIAQEMHDVLGHRVSLMALHAGALEVRPDLPPAAVAEPPALIRSTARQATGGPAGHYRRAARRRRRRGRGAARTAAVVCGTSSPLVDGIPPGRDERRPGDAGRGAGDGTRTAGPGCLPDRPRGPDQRGKHAAGAATTVSLSGRAGQGLQVTIRNRLPVGPARRIRRCPGQGWDWPGLTERVALAGGTLSHGPSSDGTFVVSAALRWPP